MDNQQLNYEFMSIISESHPGLTFEEYRDSCVFLLFYHYLCIRYDRDLEDQYKLNAMVRMAIRGKLQLPSFLRFIEQASSFIHLAGSQVQLTDLTFYRKLMNVHQLEKQKSFARFFRKLIKKIDAWNCDDLLYPSYGDYFERLLSEFARTKKESFVSEEMIRLYALLYHNSGTSNKKVFLPDFRYGILLKSMLDSSPDSEIFGYEESETFSEILRILCYMKSIPDESIHLYSKAQWMEVMDYRGYFDAVSIFSPEGSEPGNYISDVPDWHPVYQFMNSGTKGEFPMILSALPLLSETGVMAVVVPSALLYREGKESQIRRYLVEEARCLELVMLLPDQIFHSTGQNEVLLYFKKQRTSDDIMFFDCSELEDFSEEKLEMIRQSWEKRETVTGFCASAGLDLIRKNDYNLNLPRYVTKLMKLTEVDLKLKLDRIAEIDKELLEIDHKIAMYKRDLELN